MPRIRVLSKSPRPTGLIAVACMVLLGSAIACSASKASAPPSTAPPADFSGTYATRVSLATNSCGNVTIMDMPTVVTHNIAGATVVLAHAGTNYSGTVKSDSTFVTSPLTLAFNDGFSYRMSIAGKFGTKSFDALVTLDRTTIATGAVCQYTVRWLATR